MHETRVTVLGMTCGHCTSSVEEALGQLPGVSNVTADLSSGVVTVTHDGSLTDKAIADSVDEIGFEVGQ